MVLGVSIRFDTFRYVGFLRHGCSSSTSSSSRRVALQRVATARAVSRGRRERRLGPPSCKSVRVLYQDKERFSSSAASDEELSWRLVLGRTVSWRHVALPQRIV